MYFDSVALPGAEFFGERPWKVTGPGSVVQAKFGQYLQDAKPRSISQTEEAVEWEQSLM
jgi:hypothetical protein